MGTDSSIEWLGEGGITSSPWEGCTHAHIGCKAPGVEASCYAEVMNRRWRGGANWGKGAPRRIAKGFWTEVPRHARKLAAQGKRGSLFMSICDPLDPEVWSRRGPAPDGVADQHTAIRMIETVRACAGAIRWLLLTKRPQEWRRIPEDVRAHTWLLYSASDQKTLEAGIGDLLAAEGFAGLGLSLEPLLGPVVANFGEDLRPDEDSAVGWAPCDQGGRRHQHPLFSGPCGRGIGWVIIGGESGRGARPYDLAWPRSIIAQCRNAGVPVFHKQLGAMPTVSYHSDLREAYESERLEWMPLDWDLRDGHPPVESRARLPVGDAKGGDMSEWPTDLCVREWPEGLRR